MLLTRSPLSNHRLLFLWSSYLTTKHPPNLPSQSLLCVHDAIAQRDFDPSLPPAPDDALEEEDGAFKIVSLVKTKEPLVSKHVIYLWRNIAHLYINLKKNKKKTQNMRAKIRQKLTRWWPIIKNILMCRSQTVRTGRPVTFLWHSVFDRAGVFRFFQTTGATPRASWLYSSSTRCSFHYNLLHISDICWK